MPAVAVEVIGREIGEDRDIGRERAGQFGLVGGKLEHDDPAVAGRRDVEDAAPDIAGELAFPAQRLQRVVNECRGRGLAVRAGDGDDLGRDLVAVPFGGGE